MHANASDGVKVLPIARISIRNTGVLSTTAEARGNSSAGLQPPMRLRSHESDGAYASENNNAAIVIEMTVVLIPCPSTTRNFERTSSPNSQEIREIETSFICLVLCPFVLCAWCSGLGNKYKELSTKNQDPTQSLPYFFPPMPRLMMCCISSALGIPRSVAGPNPNGPPSVFAANVMLSPCA